MAKNLATKETLMKKMSQSAEEASLVIMIAKQQLCILIIAHSNMQYRSISSITPRFVACTFASKSTKQPLA